MNDVEKKILESLVELEGAVKSMASANPKPNLLPIFSRLDELSRELPRGSNPELQHFLLRKSYEKARLLLEEQARA